MRLRWGREVVAFISARRKRGSEAGRGRPRPGGEGFVCLLCRNEGLFFSRNESDANL